MSQNQPLPFDTEGRIRIVPGRNVPDLPHLAPSSALPSNADSTSTRVAQKRARGLLRTLIAADGGRDFVRGVHAAPQQAAHLVNAFRRSRKSGRSREMHRDLRAAIEGYLTALGFNLGEDFYLDGVHNLLILEPTIHVALDLYSLIAFAPTYEYLALLYLRLKLDNEDWLKRVDNYGVAQKRNLKAAVYTNVQWRVLVLNTQYFLAQGELINIIEPSARVPDSTPSWCSCHCAVGVDSNLPDKFGVLVRNDSNAEVLLPSPLRTNNKDALSLFAMLVVLQAKLADAVRNHSLEPSIFHSAVDAVISEIYRTPQHILKKLQTVVAEVQVPDTLPAPFQPQVTGVHPAGPTVGDVAMAVDAAEGANEGGTHSSNHEEVTSQNDSDSDDYDSDDSDAYDSDDDERGPPLSLDEMCAGILRAHEAQSAREHADNDADRAAHMRTQAEITSALLMGGRSAIDPRHR